MGRERTQNRTNVIRVVGISLALATLAWTFRGTEPARIAVLLSRVGGAGLIILLPQLLSLFVESLGWRLAFEVMGQRLPLAGLFRSRLATEALAQTLPMGVVFCESMKPVLLARTCGADLSTSLSGMAARKWLLLGSQSLYVAGFGLLAFPVLAAISRPLLGRAGLPYALLAGAGLLFALAAASYVLLAHGHVASRLHGLLSRLPSAWLRTRLEPLRSRCVHADRQLQRFFSKAFQSPLPLLCFLVGWLLESAETFIILYLLGVRLSWTTIGALEVSASFLRNVAFMVPAGLGVQDVSYLAFLRALGVPDALNVAAAFLLLKRGKECFWAAVGYAILALDLRALPARKPWSAAC
ncbi:MAG TPA: lysylphosphatidylglycerol synthase domain-containing protein [Polyangiaceae bacterium]|nr:lysylphosphatidylglycerol synthase domain-containing protein [Polyangiaceae bacterium]